MFRRKRKTQDNKENNRKTYSTKTTSYRKTKEGDLVSTTYKGNDWFWELRNQEFFGEGKHTTSTESGICSTTDSIFSNFFKIKDKLDRKKIREICQEAYEKTSSDTSQVTEATLLKYCSLKDKA